MKKRDKGFVKQISLERIYRLFELADYELKKHPERSKRYVELAGKISSRNKVRIPQTLKKSFCKKCGSFLKEGINSKVRVTKSYLCVTCSECGNVRKISLVKKKKSGHK